MQDSYHLELTVHQTKKVSRNSYIPIFIISIPFVPSTAESEASFGLLRTGKSMPVKSSQKNISWPSSKWIRAHTIHNTED